MIKNIIFMGTPDFALKALESIHNHPKFNVIAVYTKEPKEKGRGKKIVKSPCHIFAEENNLKVFTPKNFKNPEDIKDFKSLNADISVVAAYGIILPAEILNGTKMGCVNIHGSILPKYRGSAPIQRCIQEGNDKTGITIIQMDEGIDTGDILLIDELNISNEDTSLSLFEKLADLGSKTIIKYLEKADTIKPIKQDESHATYTSKISKQESKINWNENAYNIHNKVRAFIPFPKCTTNHKGIDLKILKTSVLNETVVATKTGIVFIDNGQMFVSCGQNTALEILEIQQPNKSALPIKEFLKGYKIESADLFE